MALYVMLNVFSYDDKIQISDLYKKPKIINVYD